MKLKLSQKTHTYKTLMILFECHKHLITYCFKLCIQMFLAVGVALLAGGASGAAISSTACQQGISELGGANDPRLPFANLPERVLPITTLEEFAQAMSQGLHLHPEQISLFSFYIQNFFDDPSLSGHYTLRHFFKILETHPQLSSKPLVREQILEISVKQTHQPQSLKDFLRTLRRKKRTRANLFQIEANLGYWRKTLGMEEPQIPSHLKREEKQAFKQKSKEEFLAHLDTVIDQGTRRRWAEEKYSPHYRSQAIELYKALEKERERLLKEGQDVKYITHAMVDVIDTIGLGNPHSVALLESKNPFDNMEGIRQVFAERDAIAFNDLNFETHFAGLRQALNDTRAIEETTDKILQIQKDADKQPYTIKEKKVLRLRTLSLQESSFRGCLGGDCSTRSYFDLALDPNFIYFTLTDVHHRSSGQITVVLGTAVNKKGEVVKTAFVDKIQNISNDILVTVLEGVRLSLKELGYTLGFPQQLGDINGLSNEDMTRYYVESEILPYLNTSLMNFEPHPHSYNFDKGFSRAGQKLEMLEFDGSIGSATVISAGEIHLPQKTPQSLSINSLFAPILALQNSSKTEDQIQFLSNIISIAQLPELGFSKETAREYIWSRIQDLNLDFKLRKKALYTLIEFEMEFSISNIWNLESLSSALKLFTQREQKLIIGEMIQWKESHLLYRQIFIYLIPITLVEVDIQILKDLLERPLWKPLLNINAQDYNGKTALMWAAEYGNINTVKVLITSGADLNIQSNDRETALMLAIQKGHIKIAAALIDAGAELSLQDHYKNIALIGAVWIENIKMVAALIDASADLNIRDNDGDTPLIWAIKKGNIDIVKALIDAGADLNIRDNDGDTPLMWAIKKGNIDIVKALVNAEADLNIQGIKGETPLMLAVFTKNTEVAAILIDAGADLNIRDNDGDTALQIAQSLNYNDIAKLLTSAGAKKDSFWSQLRKIIVHVLR